METIKMNPGNVLGKTEKLPNAPAQEKKKQVDPALLLEDKFIEDFFHVSKSNVNKIRLAILRLIAHENMIFAETEELMEYIDSLPNRLFDMDNLTEMFERADPKELETFRLFHEQSQEDTERYVHFAKQRKGVLSSMQAEIEQREQQRPDFDEDDRTLGVYKERIEPYVRDAVMALNRKGYKTVGSGYGDLDYQDTYGNEDTFVGLKLPEELIDSLEAEGIELKTDNRSIFFKCKKQLSLAELKAVWDRIVDAVPAK